LLLNVAHKTPVTGLQQEPLESQGKVMPVLCVDGKHCRSQNALPVSTSLATQLIFLVSYLCITPISRVISTFFVRVSRADPNLVCCFWVAFVT
jgi:hypothetical protein